MSPREAMLLARSTVILLLRKLMTDFFPVKITFNQTNRQGYDL